MTNKVKSGVVLFVLILAAVITGVGAMYSRSKDGKLLLPADRFAVFASKAVGSFPTRLQAQGNQLVDAGGQPVLLRGLSAPDPADLRDRQMFNVKFLVSVHEAGGNVVRVPVQPQAWVNDPDYLWRYLYYLTDWAGQQGLYVIITWDATGNPLTGEGLQVENLEGLPKDLTTSFWKQTASYFKTAPNVIFELVGEPSGMTADEWRAGAADLIAIIRVEQFTNLVLVDGVENSTDLSWTLENPIADDNLAYAAHAYPDLPQSAWPAAFEDAAARYPVLVTEWGFMDENRTDTYPNLAGDQAGYGEPLMAALRERGIGWIAGSYDDTWTPPMYAPGFQKTTRFGAFAREQLLTPAAPK